LSAVRWLASEPYEPGRCFYSVQDGRRCPPVEKPRIKVRQALPARCASICARANRVNGLMWRAVADTKLRVTMAVNWWTEKPKSRLS
jgi:hypothetical protein